MKLKTQYINFKPSRTNENYLNFKINNLADEYPEVTDCRVKIKRVGALFTARISGRYIKLDVTSRYSSPMFMVCLNRLINDFEGKLIFASSRYGPNHPVKISRNFVFKYQQGNESSM